MAAADDGLAVPPGYSFCPADKELTDIYLNSKISASHDFAARFEARFFHEADVYSAEPEKLVQPFLPAPGTGTGKNPPFWYFFSPVRYAGKNKTSGRRSRTIGGDAGKKWHTEVSQLPLKGGSAFGGYVQWFSYVVKNKAKASSGKEEDEKKRPGWIMMEYGISPEHGGDRLVLCKVYPRTVSGPEKTPAVPVPVPVPAPVFDINLRKRKAAAGDHPEAPTTRPRIESEAYGDLDANDDMTDDVNIYPITTWVTLEQAAACVPIVYEQGMDGFGIADGTIFDPTPSFSFWQQIVSGGDLATPPYAPAAQPEEDAAEIMQTITGQDQNNVIDHQVFSFWQEMEQEFEASYPISNDEVVVDGSGCYLATPPCAPAADQPEEDAAGLVQTISGEEDQNNVEDGAARTQLDEPAADEVIYGFSSEDPGFSPEMLERLLSE